MKKSSIILLLSLLLFPIIWNGITLFHFVVAHTHTFCEEDATHAHSNPEDCLSIFQLTENHSPNNQLPSSTETEFKELKQYLTPNLSLSPIKVLPVLQINFVDIAFPDNLFTKDIFHPPIFS